MENTTEVKHSFKRLDQRVEYTLTHCSLDASQVTGLDEWSRLYGRLKTSLQVERQGIVNLVLSHLHTGLENILLAHDHYPLSILLNHIKEAMNDNSKVTSDFYGNFEISEGDTGVSIEGCLRRGGESFSLVISQAKPVTATKGVIN